jgi:hypothetical protein
LMHHLLHYFSKTLLHFFQAKPLSPNFI